MSPRTPESIRLLALGSHGDVQPYVALGLGLRQAGFDVSIGTTAEFRSFVEGNGLPCIATGGLRAAIERAQRDSGHTGPKAEMASFLHFLRATALQLSEGADLLIYSFPTFFATPHVAEKLGVPALIAAFQPGMTQTKAHPLNRAPALPLGGWYNRLTFTAFEKLTTMALRSATNQWREALDLPPSRAGAFAPLRDGDTPILFGFSPTVLARPDDWSERAHVTGYWFLSERDTYRPSPELEAFLDAGPPPVSIGFGSTILPDPGATTELVLAAVERAGVRAVLIAGWGGLKAEHVPTNVFQIDHVPHDWLFPRVAAAVHHAGAGTTAASLRAGTPTVTVPLHSSWDQSFWGRRVTALGAGPESVPFQKMTVDSLAAGIRRAVDDETMRRRAAIVSERIRAEDGVGNAVREIERYLAARSRRDVLYVPSRSRRDATSEPAA